MNTVIDGIDYGPLAQLIGKWIGDRGLDNAPDANADPDLSPYTDELTFAPAGPAENAEEQNVVAVRYRHVVRKLENGQIFHDQIGHWIFDPETNVIMHSLSIPRAVCLLAGGEYQEKGSASLFNVEAQAGSETYGIVQSPFMRDKATTKAFKMCLSVEGDSMQYEQTTSLHIYGSDFEHTDKSRLARVTYELD